MDGRRRLALFANAVAALPSQCRKVLVLKKIEGLSQREIAARLGIAESTVEKHLAKALLLTRDFMARRDTSMAHRHFRCGTSCDTPPPDWRGGMSPSGNILNFPDRSPIEEEAARWVVRHDKGPLTAEERAQFEAWKQASPLHADAFARLSGHWNDSMCWCALADTPREKPLLKRPARGPASASPPP